MKAHVVIGANYGDEGKGLVTDYIVDREQAQVVVRFNGGAQAGHTVMPTSTQRHVFSHFGAGHFAGAHTYLGKRFVCNPILYLQEWQRLLDIGFSRHSLKGAVVAHPDCIFTTPFDMVLNQAAERRRDGMRHGSVGVGFNETIARNTAKDPSFGYTLGELCTKPRTALQLLNDVAENWVPLRAEELGLTNDQWLDDRMLELTNLTTMSYMAEQIDLFMEYVNVGPPQLYLPGHRIVFEGAQGLGLDMDTGAWPHVTRSNTGLCNVLEMLAEDEICTELEVIYVTRWYATRHGAGPLPGETSAPPFDSLGFYDQTNVEHPWQGGLRFAPVDVDALALRINHDLRQVPQGMQVTAALAITCLDQFPTVAQAHADHMVRALGLPVVLRGYGPARGHVHAASGAPMPLHGAMRGLHVPQV